MSTVSSARYAFLSKPPPKKRPAQLKPVPPANVAIILPAFSPETETPAITHRRSINFSSIAAWASSVQPGTPAPRSPPSPYYNLRRSSVSSILKPRRSSISHTKVSSTSGSFLHLIDTPTTTSSGQKNSPSAKDVTFDLTALGYTSFFVPLPGTPTTPSPFLTVSKEVSAPSSPPKTPSKSALSLKRIRSLGVLKRRRARGKSLSCPSSPTKSAKPASPSRSSFKKKANKNLPPTLANELLLLQFMDGGSLEKNMKRVMEKQAKHAAKNASANANGSAEPVLADAHRDGKGGLWRDEDEELEYQPLLADNDEEKPEASAVPIVRVIEASPTTRTPRKRPAPLKLAKSQPSKIGCEDSFTPASAPVEQTTTKGVSKWAIFIGKN